MSRERAPWFDRMVILVCALLGGILFLAGSQMALALLLRPGLVEYRNEVLDRAVEVASAGRAAMQKFARSRPALCSDQSLEDMRYELFRAEYLSDIGRLDGGEILCTAGWGRLAEPLKLPPPRRQVDDVKLWVDIPNPVEPRLEVDAASDGSVIVFTAPAAFKPYSLPDDDFAALVLTRDGAHIYRSFGDTAGLAERLEDPDQLEFGPRLTSAACASQLDICVVAARHNVDILRQPAPVWIGTTLLGLLSGSSLGVALVLRRRASASLPQRIRRAVMLGRLKLVYQPLVRLADQRLTGVEALARLSDDQGGPISPDIFIPVAEETGLIGEITRRVIRQALTDMRPRLVGDEPFDIHINFSVNDLLDPELLAYLDSEVARLKIPPSRVTVELTERSSADHDLLVKAVEALHQRGYEFFLDDFGTGYSNHAYLARLPISGIKIDKMFTRAIGKAAVSSAIVENICAMAEAMNVALVVEGVEEAEQASSVLKLFPQAIAQGWLFGKPVPADKIPRDPRPAADGARL